MLVACHKWGSAKAKTPSNSCKVMKVGNQGHFTAREWEKSKRTLKMRGTILFMATAFSDSRSPDRSSTNLICPLMKHVSSLS